MSTSIINERWNEMKHSDKFKLFFEMAHGGKNATKRLSERVPSSVFYLDDGKKTRLRELLQVSTVEGTNLIQGEVLGTVIEGSEPAKCVRGIIPIMQTKSNSVAVPLSETGTYAPKIAEGATANDKEIDYGSRTIAIDKYGVAVRITQEMIDDALVDVIAIELAKAGKRMENTLNQQVINSILLNAGWAQDLSGASLNVNGIILAMATMQGSYNFEPNALIMHPGLAGAIIASQSNIGAYWQANNAIGTGKLDSILGLKLGVYGGTYGGGTYTYGWGTDNYIGGILLNKESGALICMNQDIRVENYRDVLRDLSGAVVRMRFGTSYLQANALGRIQY